MWEWSVNGLVYLFLMYLFFCKKKKKCHIVFIVFFFNNAKSACRRRGNHVVSWTNISSHEWRATRCELLNVLWLMFAHVWTKQFILVPCEALPLFIQVLWCTANMHLKGNARYCSINPNEHCRNLWLTLFKESNLVTMTLLMFVCWFVVCLFVCVAPQPVFCLSTSHQCAHPP